MENISGVSTPLCGVFDSGYVNQLSVEKIFAKWVQIPQCHSAAFKIRAATVRIYELEYRKINTSKIPNNNAQLQPNLPWKVIHTVTVRILKSALSQRGF